MCQLRTFVSDHQRGSTRPSNNMLDGFPDPSGDSLRVTVYYGNISPVSVVTCTCFFGLKYHKQVHRILKVTLVSYFNARTHADVHHVYA